MIILLFVYVVLGAYTKWRIDLTNYHTAQNYKEDEPSLVANVTIYLLNPLLLLLALLAHGFTILNKRRNIFNGDKLW